MKELLVSTERTKEVALCEITFDRKPVYATLLRMNSEKIRVLGVKSSALIGTLKRKNALTEEGNRNLVYIINTQQDYDLFFMKAKKLKNSEICLFLVDGDLLTASTIH